MCTLLYKETAARVDLATIDASCALFSCSVSDLFEYPPDWVPQTPPADRSPGFQTGRGTAPGHAAKTLS